MLEFPKSTEFNKRIPKQKFYENLDISPALKRAFVEQIKSVIWKNKIAPSTTNLAPGKEVTELEVFEIHLTEPALDEAVLRQIDKQIPYHILFLLECEGSYQAWIGYKEAAQSGANAFKVSGYYHSEWQTVEELELKVEGLDLDAVYEGLVRKLNQELRVESGELSEGWSDGLSLKENIQRDEQIARLKKQIAALQARIKRERQLNKQMELNAELKKLKRELEAL